jgi:hypothetical protein
MPMSVFPQSAYLLQGEIDCEGSSAVMAMTHINGVGSMFQGGEKTLYIAGRCEQFWVISLLWKGLGHRSFLIFHFDAMDLLCFTLDLQ